MSGINTPEESAKWFWYILKDFSPHTGFCDKKYSSKFIHGKFEKGSPIDLWAYNEKEYGPTVETTIFIR